MPLLLLPNGCVCILPPRRAPLTRPALPSLLSPLCSRPLLSPSARARASQTSPASRPAHIDELISGVDRYNPQNLAVLVEYLQQQLDSGEYDCLANLAILKL